jgi:hypothetical protein
VFSSALPREHTIADQAFAFIPTDDNEHLADTVGSGGRCVTPCFFVSSHVDQ